MRTIVYVDGFNLYYGSLKGTPYKWLDLCAYFRRALPANCALIKVKYFTARVSAFPTDPDAPRRQDVYLRALRAHCGAGLEIIEGHFMQKPRTLPLERDPAQFVRVLMAEEKGSDVNVAVHIVNDAWENRFDCAAVVSNDSDLEFALTIAKARRHKKVFLFTPGAPTRVPVGRLTRWAHKKFAIDPTLLATCQLPNPVPQTTLSKPARW